MFSIIFGICWKLLEWSLVTSAVLVYVEIGPGGESLGQIVKALKDVLLEIDWPTLAQTIAQELKNVVAHILESFGEIKDVQGHDQ